MINLINPKFIKLCMYVSIEERITVLDAAQIIDRALEHSFDT